MCLTFRFRDYISDELNRIVIELSITSHNFIKKLETISKPFENSSEIIFGIKPYQVGHGTPPQTREMVDNRIYHSNTKINDEWFPLVTGTDVNRYKLDFNDNEFILYGKNLMYASNELKIKSEKILLRRTSHDLRAVVDNNLFYPQNSLFVITSSYNLKYLISLINSKLFDFIYKAKCPQVGKVFAEVKPSIIKSLPIADIDDDKQLDFADKVNLIQDLNKELQEQSQKFQRTLQRKFELDVLPKKLQDWYLLSYADFIKELGKLKIKLTLSQEAEWEEYFTTEATKLNTIKTQIDTTDKAIDAMVYELYGLNNEEIAIVENS
ncbi:TaqI-like C-terminal specificity domain-containing protein [Flavobacterium sp. N1994]|uniref:TaqI-like C-terminal specificity domain-containing protein n=1 Tax=Flavobacterium sp. N1994 TaxID=2986827 RepID=UPI002223E35B|nr:TaqI-like C-terminal specificity domain-containing protein [Flavobacterium sp. N1994]